MTLGILVKTDNHLKALFGIIEAALGAGHEVRVFIMDDACAFLTHEGLIRLMASSPDGEAAGAAGANSVQMSYCLHSATIAGIDVFDIDQRIEQGSQVNNTLMLRDSDKVICL